MTFDDLQTTFRNLRQPWPQAWPGLALVMERCLGIPAIRADQLASLEAAASA